MLVELFWAIISIAFSTVALHWAAVYADADNSSYGRCFILSLIGLVVVVVTEYFLGRGSFSGFIVYSIIKIVIYMGILKIPSENFFMFIVILTFLNLVLYYGGKLVLSGMFKAI